MKRAIAALLLVFSAAACGGTREASDPGHAKSDGSTGAMHHGDEKADCAVTEGTMKIVAKNSKFDTDCLAARAGRPFKIEMDNQDDLQHNVSIHKGDKVVFRGEIVSKQVVTYDVPAIDTGAYGFHCDVHPEMKGAFKAKT